MKNNKKILAILAGLALSGTMVVGTVGLTACNGDETKASLPDDKHVVMVDTPVGAVESETAKTYYVSPDGKSTSAGTYADPYDISFLLGDVDRSPLAAGDTVYVIPGVYNMDSTITVRKSGEFNKFIRVLNAGLCKGDAGNEYDGNDKLVTLSFYGQMFDSTARGIQLYGNYTYWYGIDVAGAGDNGFYVGGSFNTIEYGEFYDNRDSGLQLGRQESSHNSMDQWPSYNLIKNCTAHNNYDNETFGENADGFAAKLTIGFGNVFDGCIAYRNSDDGWDLYAKTDSGNIGAVIIYNCVAYENGYLEYDRETSNARFGDKFDKSKTDTVEGKYVTRDGDGNGFKLGGSVMEGDVVMYNCLSFHNRMHGVTDNSNPGYLKIEGVTSFDNSAAVDPVTGEVKYVANSDSHGNIDVARQTYSYNTVNGVLSVKSANAKSVANDAYRGSVLKSLLNGGEKTNVISDPIDADTNDASVADFTSQINLLKPEDVFVKLPIEYTKGTNDVPESYDKYNVNGAKDSRGAEDALLDTRAHKVFRNSDESINMGDLLAIKSDFDYETYIGALGEGEIFGATLNKGNWGGYTHFVTYDYSTSQSEDQLKVDKAAETLTINTEEEAVYQDFEVPVVMQGTTITWASSDENVLAINADQTPEISVSGSKYITLSVNRDAEANKSVTLTATLKYNEATATKVFNLTVMKGKPSIGDIHVVTPDGKIITDGAEIVDQYSVWSEPKVVVTNGLYYTEKTLSEDSYNVTTKYEYAPDSNAHKVEVKGFTPSAAGVYTITKTVSLKDNSESKSMTYTIYIASSTANVDFDGDASVILNKDGFIIKGNLSSATGSLYAVSSATDISVTKENIKTLPGAEGFAFRATSISQQFKSSNSGAYFIYYALTNANGEVTSEVYKKEIKTVAIDTTAKFITMAGGSKIGDEEPTSTIYELTADLDFTGVDYNVAGSFSGLLNGHGHTVSNVTRITNSDKNVGLFATVKNGTIMNIKFDKIKLAGGEVVGIIANSEGGYFYNIAVTNVYIKASQRAGGLIGRATEGEVPTNIDQVSVINRDIGTVDKEGMAYAKTVKDDQEIIFAISDGTQTPVTTEGIVPTEYYIQSTGNRAAGILGFVQTSNIANNEVVVITNCYAESFVTAGGYSLAGICAEFNVNGQAGKGYELSLTIEHCVSNCILTGTGSSSRIAGMLGYQSAADFDLTINQCVSIDTMYFGKALVDVAQKNISGMVGNYQSTAGTVTKCVALFEESNTNFDVYAYNDSQLAQLAVLFGDPAENANALLNFDLETRWTLKYKEGSTTELTRPYVVLNYLAEV